MTSRRPILQSRRRFAAAAVLAILAASVLVGCSQPQPVNVLLISLDTTRADFLGAYGHPEAETPNIDRLAAEGVLFERCVSPTPMTLPSHATMMTGSYPFAHGVRDNGNYALGEENLTLAEVLAENGFATGAQVGVFLLNRPSGLAQGFDSYGETLAGASLAANADPAAPAESGRPEELRADAVIDGAVDWLQRNSAGPFFLFVHLFDPHTPYAAPEPFGSRFEGLDGDPRVGRYLGEIAYVDQQVGRLIDELARLEIDDRTLIVLTGDHGEAFGEHSEIGHSYFVYDTTIRVPLILRLAGRWEAGRRVDSLVRLVDVAPTVLDLLGLPPLPDAQGVSLAPYLEGHPPDLELSAYSETFAPWIDYRYSQLRALRDERWKYILAPRAELYDLDVDPGEADSVLADHPDVAEEMRHRLVELVTSRPPVAEAAGPDPERRRQLESLGYLAASGAGVGEADELASVEPRGPDPKDRIEQMTRASTALHALGERDYFRAASIYRALVYEEPDNVLFLAKMAEALVGLGRLDEARQSYIRVLEIDEGHVPAHQAMVQLSLASGELRNAAVHLQQLVRLLPDRVEVLIEFGRVLAMGHQLDEAERAFRRALELDPGNPGATSLLARIDLVQGRPGPAAELLESALERRPENLQILLELAWLRATSVDDAVRDGARAMALSERAATLADPENPAADLVMAAALAETGGYEAAAAGAARVARTPPTDPRAEEWVARAAALAARALERQPYRSGEPF